MYRVLLLLLVTTGPLVGCGRPPESQPHPADRNRFERMTPQEQQQVAPNPLFVSIYKGDLEEVRVHADRSSTLLEQKNAVHGDTPLAVAIRLRERAIANEIILRMSVDSLRHKNDTGESYIYLASQQGFNDVIENLASKYEQSLGTFDVFDFSELDQETDSLERALFVALNAETAKTLQHYWFLGATHFEHPFNDFFHHRDLSLRTFLHRAAQENRFDVILWAADKTCGSNSWQDPDSFFLKRFAGHVWDFFSDNTPQTFSFVRQHPINRKDIAEDTPLHLAIRSGHLEASTALMGCHEIDFSNQNAVGNSYLIEFLKTIDPRTPHTSQNKKALFLSILDHKNQVMSWFFRTSDYVDSVDQSGRSSLHWAAILSDPFYYEALKPYGDVFLSDHDGLTPHELFKGSRH